MEVVAGKSKNASHLCHLKRSDLHMSYAVCRMQKVKSPGLKGMQFHIKESEKVERMMILTMSEHVKIMIYKTIKILITTNVSKKLLNHKKQVQEKRGKMLFL